MLTPQGHLLLIGFNPLSLRGVATRCRGLWRRSPWHAHSPVSEPRLRDWLHLLGCEVQRASYLYAIPPAGSGRLRRALEHCDGWCSAHNIPLGGVYVVHAIKQVAAQNRPRLALRSRRQRLIGLAAPSAAPTAPTRTPRRGYRPSQTRRRRGRLKEVEIFTDGACRGNPGPGGWGALLRFRDVERTLYGGERDTTNNRMELRAAIEALRALKEPCRVTLTTDSVYVKNGISHLAGRVEEEGLETAGRKPVKNVDLWQALDEQNQRHQVQWHWVKGHSGHRENEIADQLANRGIDELDLRGGLQRVRQIVLDTETTGLEVSQGHRIIEIGCVELDNRRLTGNHYHIYINPEREVDQGAIEVHGITNEFLTDKPLFAQVAADFVEFIQGAELIIHNAPLRYRVSQQRVAAPGGGIPRRRQALQGGSIRWSWRGASTPASATTSTPCASATRWTTHSGTCMAPCSTRKSWRTSTWQ